MTPRNLPDEDTEAMREIEKGLIPFEPLDDSSEESDDDE